MKKYLKCLLPFIPIIGILFSIELTKHSLNINLLMFIIFVIIQTISILFILNQLEVLVIK